MEQCYFGFKIFSHVLNVYLLTNLSQKYRKYKTFRYSFITYNKMNMKAVRKKKRLYPTCTGLKTSLSFQSPQKTLYNLVSVRAIDESIRIYSAFFVVNNYFFFERHWRHLFFIKKNKCICVINLLVSLNS